MSTINLLAVAAVILSIFGISLLVFLIPKAETTATETTATEKPEKPRERSGGYKFHLIAAKAYPQTFCGWSTKDARRVLIWTPCFDHQNQSIVPEDRRNRMCRRCKDALGKLSPLYT